MTMTDPLADMLTRIRNAQKSKLIAVNIPLSKLKLAVLRVLKKEGYIKDFKTEDRNILVYLKYIPKEQPVIEEIHRVSKPGKRIYTDIKRLKSYYNKMGIVVLTTSRGVLSHKEARALNVGGEVICKVF